MNKIKKIALLFIPVMFFFLFLVTADSAEASFGRGWYKNFEQGGAPCPPGQWQVKALLYDIAGSPLVVDSLFIDVVLLNGWSSIYSDNILNVSSFTTPCLTPGGDDDTFALYIVTNKAGYDSLFTYQFTLYYPPYAGKIIQRNLYVARTTEPINEQHISPINNQILNYSNVTNQVYFELRPGASSVDIRYQINRLDVFQVWGGTISPGVMSSGTVDLPTHNLPDGHYTWSFWMVDNDAYVYDYPWNEGFIVDTTSPTTSCSVSLSGPNYLIKLDESDATSGIDPNSGDVDVSEDGGPWTNNGLPSGGNVIDDFSYPSSAGSTYQFRYQVSDRAGWPSGWAMCDAPAEFFTILISPSISPPIEQGDPYTYQVIISSVNNFAGTVNLTHNDNDTIPGNNLLPDGITLTLGDSSVILLSGGAEFTTLEVVTDPGTPLDTYILRVTGTAGGLINFDEADLVVIEPTSDPWLKTTGGDVGSFFNIDMMRDIFTDEGLYSADYLVITKTPPLIVNFDSEKGWEINDYGTLTLDPDPGTSMYDALWDKYKDRCFRGTLPGSNPTQLKTVATSLTCNVTDFPGSYAAGANWDTAYDGNPIIVFVTGDMLINNNLRVADNTGVVFVVQGDIKVNHNSREIEGVFITNGFFNSRDGTNCGNLNPNKNDAQLVINGAIHAFGELCFTRDLGSDNEDTPAEIINFEPKYLYFFQEIVGDPTVIYREVAP